MLVKAIEAAQEQLDTEHVSAETPDHRSTFAARRADAVAIVAQNILKGAQALVPKSWSTSMSTHSVSALRDAAGWWRVRRLRVRRRGASDVTQAWLH